MEPDEDAMDEPTVNHRRARLRHAAAGLAAVALLLIGVAGGVVWSERRGAADGRGTTAVSQGASTSSGPAAPAKTDEAVEVSLTPEAVARAGIKIGQVTSQATAAGVTVPATVTSNAYRDTRVNSLVGGIVRQAMVELGAPVRRGQPLAVVFSAELAEAQMKYISMIAMLEADHQKLERTTKLVALGSASRQELEEVTAIHVGHETEVAAARQRLLLLGLPSERIAALAEASQVVSEVTVPSPADGVVISRTVNPGQVIASGQELFGITDLGTVWVIGDLYERDFPRVRVGSPATVAIPSAPDRPLKGRVSYIDPRVDPATRTAKVRVEVSNQQGPLRLGMFVAVTFATEPAQRVTVVPRAAVQTVGERTVVYVAVAGEESKFAERAVKLGPPAGDVVPVLDGLTPGEKIVTEGSFLLRAEVGRTRGGS